MLSKSMPTGTRRLKASVTTFSKNTGRPKQKKYDYWIKSEFK